MKKNLRLSFFPLLISLFTLPLIAGNYPAVGKIHQFTPGLSRILDSAARLEKVAGGFNWSEGPVWSCSGKYLLFSDIPRNTVFQWNEKLGLHVFMRPAGYSGSTPPGRELGTNGLAFDSEGNFVVCDHGNRCISRIDTTRFTHTILADRYRGKRLNSPNDLVSDSRGKLYFTDPPYGLQGGNSSPLKELDFNGVFLLKKSGELILLTREMTFPNGIGMSPDEKTLYVSQSDGKNPLWMAFDVQNDGTFSKGRIFFNALPLKQKGLKGSPDGLTVDRAGNLWASGPGGIHIFSPAGEHLGWIETGQRTANCTFGGDGSILYITADMFLLRIQTKIRGIGF